MKDLQLTYLRTTIPVRDLRTQGALQLPYPVAGVPISVTLDGAEAPFLITNNLALVALRPSRGVNLLQSPGGLDLKTTWRCCVTVLDGDATYQVVYDDNSVLQQLVIFAVTVDDNRAVTGVLVNGASVGFSPMPGSSTVLLVEVPDVGRLESFDVLAATQQLSGDAFFEYQLGTPPTVVAGLPKLVGQFLKVLQTRPGTDVARPNVGVGMDDLLQSNYESSATALTGVIQKIVLATTQIVTSQTSGSIPAAERLLSARVIGLGMDDIDPSKAWVSIQLVTLAGTQATFGSTMSALGG